MSRPTVPGGYPGVPRATLDEAQQADLRGLTRRLDAAGYEERNVCHLLGIEELHQLRDGINARVLGRAAQDTPLAHLASFWFLGQVRSRELLGNLLGEECLRVLQRLHLVEEGEYGWKACVHLFPCLGRYIFTDLMTFPGGDPLYQVYWLGADSVGLARSAPRTPVARALDLCTGSGVHAVLAGAHTGESWGVDINPRALEFGWMNAVLNGLGDGCCNFTQGSLYDPLPPGRFGLITANPPFVPTPKGDLAFFRPGGETGEDITAAIVRGLPERLEVGGTMALVSQVPVIRNSRILDRVEHWLRGGNGCPQVGGGSGLTGWGLAYIVMGPLDRDKMIAGHLPSLSQFQARLGVNEGRAAYRQEFELWLDSYEQNGIESVELSMTFVRRLEAGRPGWRAEWVTNLPAVSISGWVEAWLDAQERFSARAQDWQWIPHLGSSLRRLMVDARNGEGLVSHKDQDWRPQGTHLDPQPAFLLAHVDGQRQAQDLLEAYATRFELDLDEARPSVWSHLDQLGRDLLLA